MPKYRVQVTRITYATATIEVAAADKYEAKDQAVGVIDDTAFDNASTDYDCDPSIDVEELKE
jgi:hypothetical protein